MARLNDHEAGNKLDASVEGGHLIAENFNYTESVESLFEESQYVDLDADTEKLDIPNFVGDLRALMVDDSEDELVVLDSDDERTSEPKVGKIRGNLWRRVAQSFDVRSSAGSNLTDKVTPNGHNSVHGGSQFQEVLTEKSRETTLASNNENIAKVDQDTKSSIGDELVVESQVPGELSQANALKFVDHFLSVSVVNSSPEARIPKVDGLRSPLASCAKGSHDLAKKATLMTKIGISTFDWDENQSDHREKLSLKNKEELGIQKEKYLDKRCEDMVISKTKLDEQFERKLPKCPSVTGGNEDPYGAFDIGFNTQMAAEAMEALLYAPPPTIDANEQFSFPLRDNCDSITGEMSFNRKKVTNQSHQTPTSFHRHSKNQRELNTDLPNTKKEKRGEMSTEKCKKAPNKSLKVGKWKKQKEDSEKENIQVVYKRRESLRHMHEKVETFSPIACRTRRGSLVKKTEDTCNLEYMTHGKQDDDLLKRKMNDLDTNFFLRKRNKNPSLETISGHLKFDIWNWPKKKRTCRNTMQNAKVNSVVGIGDGNSVVGPTETEGYFKEAFLLSSVKRKPRSASKFRSTGGKKLLKGLLLHKSGQPTLADVTNTKCVAMSISEDSSSPMKLTDVSSTLSLGGEEKTKDLLTNGKSGKQLIKKKSTSLSLRNELSRLEFAENIPDYISKDLRRHRSKVEIRVLFSQNLDDDVVKQQKQIMNILGTTMAKDCSDATHFVADKFSRTKKMLEAMAFGKPVVTPLWLESCEQARCDIDEKIYILRDAKKEKEIGFSMPVSLSRARAHPLLKDRRVLITPNVEPDKEMITNLVKAVHGQVIEGIWKASTEYNISDDLIILSCKKDYEACVPFLDKGAAVYSSELLLNGIIIQKLEYVRHQLFNDHVKMKRYVRRQKKNGSQHLHGG